ncbi:homocysteine S-methyltransferase family protein [Hespellia stercorisuis]|uniref:Methionine synthase n=1 Tax=Hespellia stercorisuis DSM 15480 TaxID=1121950 RepID=A0A1M6HLV7_9FIRM|nr:homocysteine S-methyltransferase family protein [Hespellia stercorisuis]SHJ23198.1 5-methyltetrahydrofolate--homocysteine methyltransferase [Hespellia stercorisuis DSM 15480]
MILDKLGKELLFFDGGMGTQLQAKGLNPGELPETWNLTHEEEIVDIHRQYYAAGSDIVLTNTFGANALKFQEEGLSLEKIVKQAVRHAKEGAKLGVTGDRETYVALDVGPTGKLLKPMGDLAFEDAYQAFAEVMRYGEESGADLIHIETMSDTYEVKAAVLAAKEQTSLPVFVTMIFDERGKLLTGADVPSVVALLEGLRVDALGINCGLGPEQMLPILDSIMEYASIPVIVKPNAGLPVQRDGETCYDVLPQEFAETMQKVVGRGAAVIGGCCGTTPEHIRHMIAECDGRTLRAQTKKNRTIVSSYGCSVELGIGSKIIGERINPTGKSKFKAALKEHNLDYILKEGITQQEKGAHILDVNVGLPDIDEVAMMREVVEQLQSVTNLPLQIDTVDTKAMDVAMRIYNGKPMVNSVSGKKESMDAVFPLIKKYGGVVIGLTLDESGIPETAEGRLAVAEKIIAEAAAYGIDKKDIVIDVLCMTISSEPSGAVTTLKALKMVREKLGVHTVLGVSNISFGLPSRPIINANFYTMAMHEGLSAGIINPSSDAMMQSYYAFHALMNMDPNCENYIANYANRPTAASSAQMSVNPAAAQTASDPAGGQSGSQDGSLKRAVEKGLKEDAHHTTCMLLEQEKPLDIINRYLIPALDMVGKGFEKGTVFLPQLLMSAEAAKASFAVIKEALQKSGTQEEKKEKIVLATVKGDIHDIGKNIVKVLLENYSFEVIDLGKDVPPEDVVDAVCENDVKLVGLSALMTTTVVSMEDTIRQLREKAPGCRVMVGGAVLNQDYADMIGADFYGKDAMQSVYYAQKLLNE